MRVIDLKNYIETLPDDYFGVGIDDVDSWRGSYDEPAFTIGKSVSKGEMLDVIGSCLIGLFVGYKGGEYYYDENSPVNFDTYGCYTEGRYFYQKLSEFYEEEFFKGLVEIMGK